jgi:hypothetical protein
MGEAIWRLCDQCNEAMWHTQEQSCGPNDPPAPFLKDPTMTCFMHTACIRPERAERMMPLEDWVASGIAKGGPWPWERHNDGSQSASEAADIIRDTGA